MLLGASGIPAVQLWRTRDAQTSHLLFP